MSTCERNLIAAGIILTGSLVLTIISPLHAEGAGQQARKKIAAEHAADRVLIKLGPTKHEAMRTKAEGSELPGVRAIRPLDPHRSQLAKAAPVARWHVATLEESITVENAIETLSGLEGVERVEPDFIMETPKPVGDRAPRTAATDPGAIDQYALNRLALTQAWAVQSGNHAVVVAVVDTGVELSHPDLAGQIWANTAELPNGVDDDSNGFVDDLAGWDFTEDTADPFDAHGHGTHVAGIVAATRDNGIGVAGTANVSIMAVRVLNQQGSGTSSDIIAGINYAVGKGAGVINMSLGGGGFSQAFADACNEAAAANVLIFAASGNESATRISYPAGYAGVVAVGATDEHDELADFSNTGRNLELVAPGVDVLSTIVGGDYDLKSGTSMACPYAAGVGALVRSAFPEMTAAEVRARLNGTADDLGAAGYDAQFGFGRLNALRALTEATDATLPGGDNDNRLIGPDDALEENDTTDTASQLATGAYSLVGQDQDWFRFQLDEPAGVKLKLEGPEGDLDIWLYRAGSPVFIDASATVGSSESIVMNLEAGEYHVKVVPWEDAASAYELTFEVGPPTIDPGPIPIPNIFDILCGGVSAVPMAGLMLGMMGMGRAIRRRLRPA